MKLTILFIALLSSTANAADWRPLADSNDAKTFIDVQSIATSGKLRKAWFQHVELVDREGNQHTQYKKYAWTKALSYFSCEERTSATVQMLYYGGKVSEGNYLGGWSQKISEVALNDVAPDTIGEAMLNFACGQRLGKK